VKKLQDEVAALKSQKSSALDAIIGWASNSKGSSNAIPVVVAVADVFVATVAEGASEDDVSAQKGYCLPLADDSRHHGVRF